MNNGETNGYGDGQFQFGEWETPFKASAAELLDHEVESKGAFGETGLPSNKCPAQQSCASFFRKTSRNYPWSNDTIVS
jgi:hypothetical protein